MSLINKLDVDENGCWSEGTFESKSLYKGKMRTVLFSEDSAAGEYAEKCVAHYNGLSDKPEMCEAIQQGLEKFFLYMYDAWGEMDIYDDIADSLEPVMEGYKSGKKLVSYLSDPTLYVYPNDGHEDEIGYTIEWECPWEPEHQCLIVIRGDEVRYVGTSDGLDPWCGDDEYYCIWDDED
ncbi:hypothetical protein SAMN02910447_00172 [Ruminococcus sp. YE71]|uniref:DUF6985 domain-containing protein n=1 Tax=unclassified Ruminococcus TaxID=2608920 RepID=UPI0008867F7A|nr:MULTISPECIES: hypothetical protein [unclassified Ruminococcus]SDA09711.1 hypothetical protein SAMN02910446_00177 [Ruminococcus sp. YE78]SFW11545.1 hypothetical protein SAMN02910447_00172 [Ruminococcus sp. YE71]